MPILPPANTIPFPSADDVLNLARARLNDTIFSAAGNLLANTQNYTFTLLNGAFEHLQEDMADSGYPAMTRETVLEALAVVGTTDPSAQVAVSYQNYFDGVSYWDSPVLPQDLIIPLRLQERQTGTQQFFTDIQQANDGIRDQVKTLYFGVD